MKKLGLLFIICCVSIASIFAAELKNIWRNYECHNLTMPQVIDQCRQTYALPDNAELKLTRSKNDNIGMTHYTYQEYVDDVKVEGCYILIHTKNGLVTSVNGRLLGQQDMPTCRTFAPRRQLKLENVVENIELEPVIVEFQNSYRSAYKYFDRTRTSNVYIDSKTGTELFAEATYSNSDVQGSVKTIFNGTQNIICDNTNGAYTLTDNGRNILTVNASFYDGNDMNTLFDFTNTSANWNKAILSSVTLEWSADSWWYNSITDTEPDFYVQVSYNGSVLYKSGYYNDTYPPLTFPIIPKRLIEADGNIKVEILDYDGVADDAAGKVSITQTSAGTYNWNNSKTRASYTLINNPANDAHWGMEKVYDFYLSKFNQRSYDGNGSQILQLINPPSSECSIDNAAAVYGNGPFYMVYGIGDGVNSTPRVMLDLMGHEFTHLVTAANGSQNLPNYGEGGALNESFGDIMGNAVEAFTLGTTDWVFMKGKSYSNPNEYDRSLKSPKTDTLPYARPSTYQGDNWRTITGHPNNNPKSQGYNDNDWVHINCGVQDYWFYLLCQGGSGYIDDKQSNGSYSVVGIGVEKATQIVYRNLLTYITSTSKYSDSRNGSIQAAIDLYGQGSQEHQSVMNAWHAVGVGDRYIDPSEDFELKPGKYVIVANRVKEGDRNWYYMTSDLGTASTKRFQAVSTGTESMDAIDITDLEDKYVWTLEADGSNWKLKNGTQYVTWSSGNSANLGATAKTLTFDVADNQVLAHFNDGSAERYLSLNATTNNNYFAFYSGTNQVEQLFFLPYDDGSTPPVESERYIVLAQRSATSNWLYMTSDLGTASNKRYQAVDAGTSILSNVVSKDLADKYYWEIDGNKLKTAAGYSTWTSGNSANLDATGKELTIQQQTDGTYTFSFVDGDNTRYLALNKTAGNDYFAYYIGTNQKYKLTLVKEGASGTITAIEDILPEEQSATKFLYNGQIYIRRGEKEYTITGQEVR